jgi:hypothetical protein
MGNLLPRPLFYRYKMVCEVSPRSSSLFSALWFQDGKSSLLSHHIGLCSFVSMRQRTLRYPSGKKGMEEHQRDRTCLLDQSRHRISIRCLSSLILLSVQSPVSRQVTP